MHCVRLAEIAAMLSYHGPAIIASRNHIPAAAVTCYWASCRNRFELWQRTVFRFREAERAGDEQRMQRWWQDHNAVLEEILVSEILTRTTVAIMAALERKTGREEVSPVTHTIFCTHLEASNRVHQLLLRGRGNSVQGAVKLNRLRKAVERWNDILLSRISRDNSDCLRYCFDRELAAEFVRDCKDQSTGVPRKAAEWLYAASMREVLSNRTSGQSGLPAANRAIADAVLLMLQPQLFDSYGQTKSAYLHQIEQSVESTDLQAEVNNALPNNNPNHEDSSNPAADFERWYI